MSGEFSNQGDPDFEAKVQRYARIGNLWYTLGWRSENPIEAELFDRAWGVIKEKGLEPEVQQLFQAIIAGQSLTSLSEEGRIQTRKKMDALIGLYRLLEENLVLDALSPELAQAGYKKLDKKI